MRLLQPSKCRSTLWALETTLGSLVEGPGEADQPLLLHPPVLMREARLHQPLQEGLGGAHRLTQDLLDQQLGLLPYPVFSIAQPLLQSREDWGRGGGGEGEGGGGEGGREGGGERGGGRKGGRGIAMVTTRFST